MKLQKNLLGLFLLFPLLVPVNAQAQIFNASENTQVVEIEAKPIDKRALVLKNYLAKHNSPLENSAQDFIDAADKYQIDWKLVVSISGVESTFGKRIPGGHDPLYTTYNGWGWGVYGDNALGFKSWRDAIFTISKGLKENYVDKGYKEPLAMNKKYAASQTWGVRVVYFMNEIEKFANGYQFEVELEELELAKMVENMPETAGLSTQLANNSHSYSLNVLH
jgi:beta-N-acetylglucosaminidase